MIKNLYVTGYRSYELGVWSEEDPKLTIVKEAIKAALIRYLENGLEWVVITGNLGVELWTGEVVIDLRQDYPDLKYSILYPYLNFGKNWNEKNRSLLEKINAGADYTNATSHQDYQNPGQLKSNQAFVIRNCHGSLLVYDREFEGTPKYSLQAIEAYQSKEEHSLEMISMYDLQEVADNYQFKND